jgi:hypothetical protein
MLLAGQAETTAISRTDLPLPYQHCMKRARNIGGEYWLIKNVTDKSGGKRRSRAGSTRRRVTYWDRCCSQYFFPIDSTERRRSMNSSVLSISPSIYREYADEYKKLARSAFDEPQRALYLKMASMWEHAALRFENGLDTSGPTSDRDLGNRES